MCGRLWGISVSAMGSLVTSDWPGVIGVTRIDWQIRPRVESGQTGSSRVRHTWWLCTWVIRVMTPGNLVYRKGSQCGGHDLWLHNHVLYIQRDENVINRFCTCKLVLSVSWIIHYYSHIQYREVLPLIGIEPWTLLPAYQPLYIHTQWIILVILFGSLLTSGFTLVTAERISTLIKVLLNSVG